MVTDAAIAPPIARRRLRRRTEHRLVAGVAGGVADWLNAPVAFIRFMFGLALWLMTPWSIFAYAVAALLVPASGRNRPDWDNLIGAGRVGLPFAVLLLAAPRAGLGEDAQGPIAAWIAAYGLLAVGAAVLLSADYVRGRARAAEEARASVIAALPVAACAAVIVAGIVLFPDVRWDRAVPVAAVAGGAALLLSHRREFVAPAVLALGAAVVITVSGARLEGGLGDVRLTPIDAGEPIVAKRAFGDVTIDLSRLRRSEGPITVEVQTGYGDVDVTVPTRAAVEIDARAGQGRIYFSSVQTDEVQGFGRDLAGYGLELSDAHPGLAGAPRVRVTARVGTGDIRIYRGPQ
jgi:phage shock protein PspC (stress-responsive transcriptional regulator)